MYQYDAESAAFLATAPDVRVDLAVWVVARNRATGADEASGLWTGDDHATLTIAGESRTYFGAGAILAAEDIVFAPGPDVQRWSLDLSGVAPEVRQAWQTFEARGARVEAHQVLRRPVTHRIVGVPRQVFDGVIVGLSAGRPAAGNPAVTRITLETRQREMIRPLELKKSDAHHKRRLVGGVPDRGRKWGLQGDRTVPWGDFD